MRRAAAKNRTPLFPTLALACSLAVAGPAFAQDRLGGGGFGGAGFGERGGFGAGGFMPLGGGAGLPDFDGPRRREFPPARTVVGQPEPGPTRARREPKPRPIRPEPGPVWTVAAPIRPPSRAHRTVNAPVVSGAAPVQTIAGPSRPARTVRPPPPAAVARAFPPPPGETRFRAGEVLVELADATPSATIATILRIHRLVEARVVDDALVGTSIRLWRIPDARAVAGVVRELGAEAALLSVQPNYLYQLEQASPAPGPATPGAAAPPADAGASAALSAPAAASDPLAAKPPAAPPASASAAAAPAAPLQYYLVKLHVDDAMVGDPIRVAVIDTAIDDSHPDLAGAVEARFDAIGGAGPPRSLDHGTSIAGAIAARGRLKGVAPNVRILSARAFDSDGGKALGDTLSIIDALVWADKERARVVNMSFTGAPDPALHKNLAAAFGRGLMLVGAAGNAGPKSPPLYPAADENVLAVTATDADDNLYRMANVGRYIAVAAPGVDVLLPAPRGAYAMETGTSVSAALVSGVAALLLERRGGSTPAELKRLLMTTATPLGTKAQAEAFGAGLVDARRALSAQAQPPTN